MSISVFPGTDAERNALLLAIGRYCGCERDEAALRVRCAPHSLLLDDSVLKRLIFYRRWQRALHRGEWLEQPGWQPAG